MVRVQPNPNPVPVSDGNGNDVPSSDICTLTVNGILAIVLFVIGVRI